MNRLEIINVNIGYRNSKGELVPAVIDASFQLNAGESLGIVGESGSGKSTLARALLGYCRAGGVITSGAIRLNGIDLCTLQDKEMRKLRGATVAFVPQNPLSSLTPHMRVGKQVVEAVRIHQACSAQQARARTLELFAATNLPDPSTIYDRFPHELSGGQLQRVVIAAALAGEPELVVLDEPTTALDKTTEVQVLDLVQQLQRNTKAALIYVSHDLNVISRMCDRVLVMLNGKVIEAGPTRRVYRSPEHLYTKQLIAAIPSVDTGPAHVARAADEKALLQVESLSFSYAKSKSLLSFMRQPEQVRPALDRLSFEIWPGETLGLVGESGSGKSTAAATIAGLQAASGGTIHFDGNPLAGYARDRSLELRRRIQIVFQNPLSSLNPRHRVGAILMRPLEIFERLNGNKAKARALELLEWMQLGPELFDCYPRQLSGGQQQRIAIARAFAAKPDLIICDEITSALDVSVQAQVLALLKKLQRETGTSYLFISHDLGVIRQVSNQVVVLQHGVVREAGPTDAVFGNPRDAYTMQLLAAAKLEGAAESIEPADGAPAPSNLSARTA
jgi:peptide/nickel transport system ATP-binding protein